MRMLYQNFNPNGGFSLLWSLNLNLFSFYEFLLNLEGCEHKEKNYSSTLIYNSTNENLRLKERGLHSNLSQMK